MSTITLPSNPSEDDTVTISDGRKLIRKNGAWRQKTGLATQPSNGGTTLTAAPFDRYDLKKQVTTGELDLSLSQVFTLDNRDGSKTTSLYLSNAPADRCMTVILEIEGIAGAVNYPGGITWANGVPPLSPYKALIILFWNGQNLIGAAGPKLNPLF